MGSRSELAAKVRAVNAAHAEANRIFPILQEFFKPYVGQQVLLQGGGLLKKIKNKLPKFENLHVFMDSNTRYSLKWEVKACEHVQGEQHVVYHSVTIYVGNIDGLILKDVYPEFSAKDDYTVEEIEAARLEYKRLKELADNAKSALAPFGEY